MNAIEINNLEKKYKNFKLGSIDLNIPSGMIVGLIGENGAGKTTLIKSILNIIKVDNGSIKIFDKDISKYDEFHSDRVLRYNFFERFDEGLFYIRILNHHFRNILLQ